MARTFETDIAVTKELHENETIRWKGASEKFPLIDSTNKGALTTRWIICAIAAVALVVLYFVLNAAMGSINVWLLILLLLVVAYFVFLPWLDRNNIYKNCKYYITNERVLLYYGEREFYSLPVNGLKSAILDAGEDRIHIELGSRVGVKTGKLRTAAFVPQKDDNGNVTGMVLYNMEDNDVLRRIFS